MCQKVFILFLFCLLSTHAFADPPKDKAAIESVAQSSDQTQPKPKPAKVDRSELSELARFLDNLLFGNGLEFHINGYWRNPFLMNLDAVALASAIEEIKKIRGKDFEGLVAEGTRIYLDYKKNIKKKAIDIMRERELHFFSTDILKQNWEDLLLESKEGERPLNLSERHLKATNSTFGKFPGAFKERDRFHEDLELFRDLYRKNFGVSENFDSVPDKNNLSEEAFEKWKEESKKFLIEANRKNTLYQIEIAMKHGNSPFRLVVDVTQKDGRVTKEAPSLSWEELRDRLILENKNDSGQFAERTRIDIRATSGEYVSDSRFFPIFFIDSNNPVLQVDPVPPGALDVERAAEAHVNRLLQIINKNNFQSYKTLLRFSYEEYRHDGGKRFFKDLNEERESGRASLKKAHEVPLSAVSSPPFKGQVQGTEIAFWSKYSEALDYWNRLQKESTWFEFLAIQSRLPEDLQKEPPKPTRFQKEIKKAKKGAAALASKYSASLKVGIALAVLPFLSSAHRPAISGMGPAILSAAEATAEHIRKVKPEGATSKPDLALDIPEKDTPSKTMPGNMSRTGEAFNKDLAARKNETYFHIESSKDPSELPTRFAFGDPEAANIAVEVQRLPISSDYALKSAKEYTSIAEIPTGDGEELRYLEVTDASGSFIWEPGTDYDVKKTPDGQIVVFPRIKGAYKVKAGFSGSAVRPALFHPLLDRLDHQRVLEFAEEMEKGGAVLLPRILKAAMKKVEDEGKVLSVFDLKAILQAAAFYSQVKEKGDFATQYRSEVEKVNRFLNDKGTHCYQCDGAQELGVLAVKRSVPKDVEVTPRTVLMRNADELTLGSLGLHADFVVKPPGGVTIPLDTTPGTPDPNDPKKGQIAQFSMRGTGINDANTSREVKEAIERELADREKTQPMHQPPADKIEIAKSASVKPEEKVSDVKAAKSKVAKAKPAQRTSPTEMRIFPLGQNPISIQRVMPKLSGEWTSPSDMDWLRFIKELSKKWYGTTNSENPGTRVLVKTVSTGGPDPDDHSGVEPDSEKTEVLLEAPKVEAPKIGALKLEAPAWEERSILVVDPRLQALEDQVDGMLQIVKKTNYRVDPRKVNPFLALMQTTELLRGWARLEIPFSKLKSGMEIHLPERYGWPGSSEPEQLHQALLALERHQENILKFLQKLLSEKRKEVKEIRFLNHSKFIKAKNEIYLLLTQTPWQIGYRKVEQVPVQRASETACSNGLNRLPTH